ncbi:DUF937 domain-containing protein [Kangiella sp. HZ709]|uniref:DUF937 domain-containing protein n=1 Tax=Kangiella sp. HZ709 TaxID=2666328 RepID=UPI0012B0B8FD|nr:DUF937 domain-containing protein [Kangiella sp. HZ709]MRX27579.1 DUF937 domain-containing protein [Kangiella sp. HZ709]
MGNLLEMVLGQQNSGAIGQIAKSLNLDAGDAMKGLGSLLPALQGGMKNNVAQGGLESLLGALTKNKNQQYIEQPEMLGQRQAIDNGNSILGHLLGSKEQSRQVAQQASAQSGLDSSILKKMLPMAATVLMGSLGKQNQQQPMAKNPSMLQGLLDSDGDGSMMDDIMGMAGKLFR